MDRKPPKFLTLPDRRLAYQLRRGKPGSPGIVFFNGYASNMSGIKAEFLDERCSKAGLSFLRFDSGATGNPAATSRTARLAAGSMMPALSSTV